MVFLLIIAVTVILIATLAYLMCNSKSGALFELKNDIKASYPAILSNVEDILFCWSDRVCKNRFRYVTEALMNYFDDLALFQQSTRVAVLTGGNRGIGLHVLKKLLVCEMTVVLGK